MGSEMYNILLCSGVCMKANSNSVVGILK